LSQRLGLRGFETRKLGVLDGGVGDINLIARLSLWGFVLDDIGYNVGFTENFARLDRPKR
jgi:hypothetical protein